MNNNTTLTYTSTYTGHGNCRRCGEEIPPHRTLCDVCRKVPDNPISPYNPTGESPQKYNWDYTKSNGCLHENCAGCKAGTCNGVHMISCPCPKCSPRC